MNISRNKYSISDSYVVSKLSMTW